MGAGAGAHGFVGRGQPEAPVLVAEVLPQQPLREARGHQGAVHREAGGSGSGEGRVNPGKKKPAMCLKIHWMIDSLRMSTVANVVSKADHKTNVPQSYFKKKRVLKLTW